MDLPRAFSWTWVVLSFGIMLPFSSAQGQEEPGPLWQLLWLQPEAGKRSALAANLGTFVSEYDPEGPCHAWVLEVLTGPRTGELLLERGPLSLADLDAECSPEGLEYWGQHIAPNVAGMTNEYFLQDLALSYPGASDSSGEVQYVRFFEVKPGMEDLAASLMRKLSDRIAEAGPDAPWAFFTNFFEAGNTGRSHFAIASYHSSMEELAGAHRLDRFLNSQLVGELEEAFLKREGLVLR